MYIYTYITLLDWRKVNIQASIVWWAKLQQQNQWRLNIPRINLKECHQSQFASVHMRKQKNNITHSYPSGAYTLVYSTYIYEVPPIWKVCRDRYKLTIIWYREASTIKVHLHIKMAFLGLHNGLLRSNLF